MTTPKRKFPSRFVWGVATAAPQIEGSSRAAGKGESIWDRFTQKPGAIANGDVLDPACDHYRRFRTDFALMRRLGIRNYRLSIAWPRIFPDGDGTVNRKGVDFYHRLFDSLGENGITPWVTLYHWDLPQALEDAGGWRSRAIVDAFVRYAGTVVKEYRGQVKNWITLNEVTCFTKLAYGVGRNAPGTREGDAVVNQTKHHALLCHGHAVCAVREHGGRGASVGIADNCSVKVPISDSPEDIGAARQAFIEGNQSLLGPIYTGAYSERYMRECGADRPRVSKGDLALIGLPTDFLGLNIYTGSFARCGKRGRPEVLPLPPHYPHTDSSWLHYNPQALHWGPRFCHEAYGTSQIYITENGCGFDDDRVVKGEVHDLHRCEYLRAYLGELQRAVASGVPVAGYFLWSFIDNFEWQDGYARRFGIVHVDYKTQRRTPKLSAYWYSRVIKANALA